MVQRARIMVLLGFISALASLGGGCGSPQMAGMATATPGNGVRASGGSVATATRALTPTATATVTLPADFALFYSSTVCGERTDIDTFNATYTYVVPQNAYNGGTQAIALQLLATDLLEVYRVIVTINFFSYPDMLDTSWGDGISGSYKFYRVRINGQLKELRWTDKHPLMNSRVTPVPRMVAELNALNNLLFQTAQHYPAVQQLKRGVSCT